VTGSILLDHGSNAQAVDTALLVLRLGFGMTLSLHGLQKLAGWFDGGGLKGTGAWFAQLGFANGRMAAIAAGSTEVIGGWGLAVGLLTPLAACAVIGVMTVAAIVNHQDGGFWSVRKGWELNFYFILAVACLAVAGAGRWSLDHLLGWQTSGITIGAAAALLGVVAGLATWSARSRLG
jgi:putative oxidoreductase